MQINGKVYCLFEQSGTFKREFKKLGIPAEDYDIQNHFGQTDCIIDLFAEIESAYDNKPSIFDRITPPDLVMAFFPCIYFSCMSQMQMCWTHRNYRYMSVKQKTDAILQRSENRERFFRLAVKLHSICYERNLRLIMENPWSEQAFLKTNFITKPSVIDTDRTMRGDKFVKPTAYWFVNCTPTHGQSLQPQKASKSVIHLSPSRIKGSCSEERSLISPDYARNFICDFILGKKQQNTLLTLF